MATSLFGLFQGGAQRAVRDAAIAEHPRALQRAAGSISTGTLRAGANPVAVARQVAQARQDAGARLAAQNQAALAQAKMDDAAGASQIFGNALGSAASLGAMLIPGAQAAAPAVGSAVSGGVNALTKALQPQQGPQGAAQGPADPRGALAGAQPVQAAQQPLTAAEGPLPVPGNPYETLDDLAAADQGSLGGAFPVLPAQEQGSEGETLGQLQSLLGMTAPVENAAAGLPTGQSAPSPAPFRPLVATPERMARHRRLRQEGDLSDLTAQSLTNPMPQPQAPAGFDLRTVAAGAAGGVAPTVAASFEPGRHPEPTLAGDPPAAAREEFNSRMAAAARYGSVGQHMANMTSAPAPAPAPAAPVVTEHNRQQMLAARNAQRMAAEEAENRRRESHERHQRLLEYPRGQEQPGGFDISFGPAIMESPGVAPARPGVDRSVTTPGSALEEYLGF